MSKVTSGVTMDNAPKCVIRRGRTSEAEALSDLAFRSKAYWGYSAEFMQDCQAELTLLPEDVASPRSYVAVAEVSGNPVGFYALGFGSSAEAELEALFVEPREIGKGFGRFLIEDAKRVAAAKSFKALIIQGDPNAEGFYRAVGAVCVGKRESESIRGRHLPLFRIDLTMRPKAP